MGDESATYDGSTVPVIASEDTGNLTGALRELYGGSFSGRPGSRPMAPRPITGPSGERRAEDEELPPRTAPTIDDTILEEDIIPGRYWDYNLKNQIPVLKDPKSKDAKAQFQPPWGEIDMHGVVKSRVPLTLVGAAQILFNAAKYSRDRFTGMMTMMDVQDLPKTEFVYFSTKSADPLKDGYVTMWRIVSRVAYEQHYRIKMEFDKNPDKKRQKLGLFDFIDKCVTNEKKNWGKGKALAKLKFEDAEDEGDEPEEEEEEEEAGDGQGHERLNEMMKMLPKGRNDGEWGLGFGFMTESDIYRVYRVWSRPIYHPLAERLGGSAPRGW